MMAFSKEQVFLVTGASSGLGRGLALQLVELGATVVGIARRKDALQETQKQCKYPENFYIEVKDLSEDIESLPKYVTSLKKKYGKFQGLAYCAGVSKIMPLQAISYEEMEASFKVNYFAPIFMAKGVADKRNNVGEGTSIVGISSSAAHNAPAGMTIYAGNKAALAKSFKVISRELASQGVRVNTVSPSLIDTDMSDDIARSYGEGKYPLGFGEVADVSNMMTFLLSEKAKWLSGQDYVVDCGSI
jgi:NAD(P)-dependent dehydrogenase (short-subunit alcohol dehydrogenase family)